MSLSSVGSESKFIPKAEGFAFSRLIAYAAYQWPVDYPIGMRFARPYEKSTENTAVANS